MRRKIILVIFIAITSLLSLIIFSTQEKNPEILDYKKCSKITDISRGNECYASYFVKESQKIGQVKMLEEVGRLEGSNQFVGRCHSISHLIGQKLYKLKGVGAIEGNIDICSQGVMHGITEGAGKTQDVKKLKLVMQKICDISKGAGCFHGAGHALGMSGISMVDTADVCESFTLKNGDKISLDSRFQCLAGYIMQKNIDKGNPKVTKSEIAEICSSLSGEALNFCTIQYNRGMIGNIGERVPAGAEQYLNDLSSFCRLQIDGMIRLCFVSMGMSIADGVKNNSKSTYVYKWINKYCDGKNSIYCINGYSNIVYSLLSERATEDLKRMCLDIKGITVKSCLEEVSSSKAGIIKNA